MGGDPQEPLRARVPGSSQDRGDPGAAGHGPARGIPPAWRRLLAARFVAAALVVATAAAWGLTVHLHGLPSTDRSGRRVLYYWHQTSDAWLAVCLAVAGLLSLVLAAWVLLRVGNHVPGRWRRVVAVVGAIAWLGGAAFLAAWVFVLGLLAGLTGTQTAVRGPGGEVVVISRSYDGDFVDVWRQEGAVTYVQEPGTATVDPMDGPCRLEAAPASRLRLSCGTRSQLLSAAVAAGS